MRDKELKKISDRRYQIKKFYGLSWEEYQRLVEVANGLCPICGREMIVGGLAGNSCVVDHAHSADGKARGIICNNCNRALGLFGDSIYTLLNAVNYLRKFTEGC